MNKHSGTLHYLTFLANEDGSYVVPQKTFCDSGLEDYSVFQESDLVLNNASSVESQKQVLNSNALQTCIFTLQVNCVVLYIFPIQSYWWE